MHSSGFVKNSETRLLHLHLEVIIFFFRLRCSPRFQLELSLHWIACGNLLPLLLQRLWNRCSFKPFSHCCHWFDILVERNKRIREWIDRLCVVDSVSFSPFSQWRQNRPPLTISPRARLCRKNMADGSIFDIPKAISRAGLYQSWREKRLWIPKVICVRQISSILLQRDLIFHRSITLNNEKWRNQGFPGGWGFSRGWGGGV